MAVPTFRNVGTIASAAGSSISPGLPSGTSAGDLLLLFLETDRGAEASASGYSPVIPAGYVETAADANNTHTRLTILYKIAVDGESAPTTNAPTNHIIGRMCGVTTGTFNPWQPINAVQTSVEDTEDISASVSGATTTTNDCLVFVAISNGNDPPSNNTTNYSAWTNAGISPTERIDNRRVDGNGGGLGVATGTKAVAGAIGATTAQLGTASYKAMACFAIAGFMPLPTVSTRLQAMNRSSL